MRRRRSAELLDRRPARAGLGHGARRDLRRQPDAEHRGDLQHQRPAVWRQLHRRPPGEHRSARPARVQPADFLRPYRGYRHHRRSSEHRRHRLQLAAGAAQSPLHQAACSSRSPTRWPRATTDGITSPYVAADQDWYWRAPTGGTQLHNLIMSYTWDVPDGSRLWNNGSPAARSTAGSSRATRLSSSGDWAGVTFSTTDNFDFYGGGRAAAASS